MNASNIARCLLFLSFIIPLGHPMPAQQYVGGMAFFSPGIQSSGLSALNSRLPPEFPDIHPKPWVTTGEVYLVLSNVILGGQGSIHYAGQSGLGYYLSELSSRSWYFTAGYLIYHHKKFYLFPAASAGRTKIELYIHRTNRWITFESLSPETYHATSLFYLKPTVKFSMTGSWIIDRSKTSSHSGFVIGVETGYQMPVGQGEWRYDNGRVKGGPDINPGGFFVQLNIGGGMMVDVGN